MANYLFSNGLDITNFDPLADTFLLDNASGTGGAVAITLAGLRVAQTADGVTFTWQNQSVTIQNLTNDLTTDSLASSLSNGSGNILFDGAGVLSFGDSNAATGSDTAQTVNGGTVDDILIGTDGNDVLKGLTGNDQINGGAGNDDVRGAKGNDILFGGDGADYIVGATGDDILDGGNGNDVLDESNDTGLVIGTSGEAIVAGNNLMRGGAGDDTIIGGAGNDNIGGGMDNDDLRGGAGNDTILGGLGNDLLIGEIGDDTLTGNGGVDTFAFVADGSQPGGSDTVTDFTQGTDLISLVDAAGNQLTGTALSNAVNAALASFSNGSFTLDNDQTVTLTGITTLNASDFAGVTLPTNPDLTGLTSTFAADAVAADLDTSVTVSSGTTDGAPADWDGGSLSVSSTGGANITLGGSVTLVGNLVIVGGDLVGEVTNAFGDASAAISFNEFATSAHVEAIIEDLQVEDGDTTPTTQNLNVTLTNGDGNSDTTTVTVTTNADTALAISNLDGDSTLVQTIDSAVAIDVGGNAAQNIDTSQGTASGSVLTVAIGTGVDADDDHLSLSGTATIYNNSLVVVGSTIVGTITGNNGTSLTITFNSDAADSDVDAVLQAVTFDTDVGGNDGDRTITATLTSGVSSDSDTVTATVSVAGNVFVLTDDDVGLNTPDLFTGTSGVDVFSGASGVSATAGTLDDLDVLDGGAGSMSDRLIADLGDGPGGVGESIDPTISNINFFELTSTLGPNTLDFTNITDVTDITVLGAQNLTLDNLIGTVTNIDASAAAGVLTVNVAGAGALIIAGGAGADAFNFGATLDSSDEIDGNGAGDTLNGQITANYVAHIDDVESINITAEGDFSIDATDINTSGTLNLDNGAMTDVDLTVTGLDAGITTVDASGLSDATDSVALTFAATSGAVTVVGSAGDDVFTFGNTLANSDDVDGAAGTDSLTATIADNGGVGANTVTPNIDDVETITLAVEDTDSLVTIVTTSITGTGMTLNLNNGVTTDVDVAIAAVGSVLTVIDASGLDASTDSVDLTFDAVSNVTVTGSAGDDALDFGTTLTAADDVDGGMGTDSLDATFSAAVTFTAGMLDNVETLNFVTNGGGAYAVSIAAATGVTTLNAFIDDVGTDTTFTLADSVTTVDINDGVTGGADQDITVNGIGASSLVSSINAAGLDDAGDSLTVDVSLLTTAISITGSSGDDAITGGSGGDMLIGGDGADTITAGAGVDAVQGGAGIDTIVFGTNLTAADDVDGGADADTLTASFGGSFTAAAGLFDAVETVTLAVTADATIDISAATGVDAVNLDLATNNTTVTLTLGTSTTDTVDFDGTDLNLDVTVNGITAASTLDAVDASGLTDTNSSLTIDASLSTSALMVTGSGGTDSIIGSTVGDTLLGGAGVDTISGGTGSDNLTGGAGADTLTGGSDGDTYIYAGTDLASFKAESATVGEGGTGRDRIVDFSLGEDLIDIDAFDGATDITWVGTGAFTAGVVNEVRYAQSGADTIIQFDLDSDGISDASIVLTGVYTLSQTDFVGVV